MEPTYQWDGSSMSDLASQTRTAEYELSRALGLMNALMSDIESDSAWLGEHKDMFMAWMDLLHTYHKKLADEKIGDDAMAKLNDFIRQWSSFYADSPSMARLRSIS